MCKKKNLEKIEFKNKIVLIKFSCTFLQVSFALLAMIVCFVAAAEEAKSSSVVSTKSANDRSKRGLYYAPAYAPYAAPYIAPYASPYASPYAAPYVAPYAAPYAAPYVAPYAPYTSSYVSSYTTYPYGYAASPYGFF